jgi:hypothetical protein
MAMRSIYNYDIIIQFFIIYVPSQQLQGQLQMQHSVDTGNHVKDKHEIRVKTRGKLQTSTGERKHTNTEKVNKENTKMMRNTQRT